MPVASSAHAHSGAKSKAHEASRCDRPAIWGGRGAPREHEAGMGELVSMMRPGP